MKQMKIESKQDTIKNIESLTDEKNKLIEKRDLEVSKINEKLEEAKEKFKALIDEKNKKYNDQIAEVDKLIEMNNKAKRIYEKQEMDIKKILAEQNGTESITHD